MIGGSLVCTGLTMSNRTDPQGYSTKVTRLGDGYGIRVLKDGKVRRQGKAATRMDIGPVLKDLLRSTDILDNYSEMASASRDRNYCRGGKRILP